MSSGEHRELEREARGALQEHAARVGADARARYGGDVDWVTFQQMLTDDTVARFPVVIEFGAERLSPGEFAWAEPRGARARRRLSSAFRALRVCQLPLAARRARR